MVNPLRPQVLWAAKPGVEWIRVAVARAMLDTAPEITQIYNILSTKYGKKL